MQQGRRAGDWRTIDVDIDTIPYSLPGPASRVTARAPCGIASSADLTNAGELKHGPSAGARGPAPCGHPLDRIAGNGTAEKTLEPTMTSAVSQLNAR